MAEWLLLAVFSLFLVFHTMPKACRTLNTDFPNYYLAAQLARQHYDLSQAYDWRWLQREKDHRMIDQRVIGLAPITPFSTLFVMPLTGLQPLVAKRVWLGFQLALAISIALILHRLTLQPYRRIALLAFASLPFHRNLLYGQYYLLLLAMLCAACWAYRRHLSSLAGALIAIAAMTKIFPAVFLVYFVRKKDWRALLSGLITLCVCGALSVWVFGWSIHRQYLYVVLPATLRGDTLPPYALASSSLSTLLHRLFLFEPQWNPHPWHDAPIFAAVLAPVVQMLILGTALLLIKPGLPCEDRTIAPLEWSALLIATLTISTVPASYNFILLMLPVAVLLSRLPTWQAGMAASLYLLIGLPASSRISSDGLAVMLHVSRLYFLIAFTGLACWSVAKASRPLRMLTRTNLAWGLTLALVLAFSIASGMRHQRDIHADYAYRLSMPSEALFAASPASTAAGVRAIVLWPSGYRASAFLQGDEGIQGGEDQLSFAANSSGRWIEEVGGQSTLRSISPLTTIENAHSPRLSADHQQITYVREDRGQGQIFTRSLLHPAEAERALTPILLNARGAVEVSSGSSIVSASIGESPAHLFQIDAGSEPKLLPLGEARDPALSPDHHWLAYSRFQSGFWNLWLLDRSINVTRRLAAVPCNQVESAWEDDSKTLLYASDCGRALGFTAICRRRVIQ